VSRVGSAVRNHQVYLSIFIPVHRGQTIGPGSGGKLKLRTESAVTIIDQDGNSIGAGIDCGQVGNMVAIKISNNKLGRSRSDWVTLCGKTLAKRGERYEETKRGGKEARFMGRPPF
jgi:hypothetical protein